MDTNMIQVSPLAVYLTGLAVAALIYFVKRYIDSNDRRFEKNENAIGKLKDDHLADIEKLRGEHQSDIEKLRKEDLENAKGLKDCIGKSRKEMDAECRTRRAECLARRGEATAEADQAEESLRRTCDRLKVGILRHTHGEKGNVVLEEVL